MALDGGASIGIYAVEMARYAGHVIAFEANPEVAAFAARVLPRNVELVNVELSSARQPGPYARHRLPARCEYINNFVFVPGGETPADDRRPLSRLYSSPGSIASSSVRQPGRGALTSTAMLPGG
jgi:hypothetical protein